MKKIYFLLVFVLLFGFVGLNKASGQVGCEVCVAPLPGMCYVLNFSIPGCCDNMQAVFCYECYVTRPGITIYVAEITYCPQCEDAAWDYVHNWVLEHIEDLCGNRACDDPPPMEIHITHPMCGEARCEGTPRRFIFRSHPGACDKRCETVYEWCWDFQLNRSRLTLLSYQIINPDVDCRTLIDSQNCYEGAPPWRIECGHTSTSTKCPWE